MPGDCAIGVKGICHSNELVGGYWLPWLGEHSCRPDQLPNAVSTPTCKGRLANTQHFGLNKGGSGNMVDRLRTLQTLESGMATVSGQNPDHSGDLDAQIAVSWFIFFCMSLIWAYIKLFQCTWFNTSAGPRLPKPRFANYNESSAIPLVWPQEQPQAQPLSGFAGCCCCCMKPGYDTGPILYIDWTSSVLFQDLVVPISIMNHVMLVTLLWEIHWQHHLQRRLWVLFLWTGVGLQKLLALRWHHLLCHKMRNLSGQVLGTRPYRQRQAHQKKQ